MDHLVALPTTTSPLPIAHWVWLTVGLASDEYQLSNAEQETTERVRGCIRPDRDSYLVTWLAQVGQRPHAELPCDGAQAAGLDLVTQQPKVLAQGS